MNSYATGKVTPKSNDDAHLAGGLIGSAQASYIVHSYFDKESTGQFNAIGSKLPNPMDMRARTTDEMKEKSTYRDWDFDNTWEAPNGSLPGLRPYIDPSNNNGGNTNPGNNNGGNNTPPNNNNAGNNSSNNQGNNSQQAPNRTYGPAEANYVNPNKRQQPDNKPKPIEQPAKPKPETKPQTNIAFQQKNHNAIKYQPEYNKETLHNQVKVQRAKPKDLYSYKDRDNYNNPYRSRIDRIEIADTKKKFDELSILSNKASKKKDIADAIDGTLSSKPMNIVQTYDFFLSEKSSILKKPLIENAYHIAPKNITILNKAGNTVSHIDKLPNTSRLIENAHHIAPKNIIILNKAGNTVPYIDKLPNTARYLDQGKISLSSKIRGGFSNFNKEVKNFAKKAQMAGTGMKIFNGYKDYVNDDMIAKDSLNRIIKGKFAYTSGEFSLNDVKEVLMDGHTVDMVVDGLGYISPLSQIGVIATGLAELGSDGSFSGVMQDNRELALSATKNFMDISERLADKLATGDISEKKAREIFYSSLSNASTTLSNAITPLTDPKFVAITIISGKNADRDKLQKSVDDALMAISKLDFNDIKNLAEMKKMQK